MLHELYSPAGATLVGGGGGGGVVTVVMAVVLVLVVGWAGDGTGRVTVVLMVFVFTVALPRLLLGAGSIVSRSHDSMTGILTREWRWCW